MLLWILLVGFLIFRWKLLEPLLGTVYMYLFDTFLFTILAAGDFARPGSIPWVGYVIGCVCVLLAINTGRKYLIYSKIQRTKNERKSSDSDSTR